MHHIEIKRWAKYQPLNSDKQNYSLTQPITYFIRSFPALFMFVRHNFSLPKKWCWSATFVQNVSIRCSITLDGLLFWCSCHATKICFKNSNRFMVVEWDCEGFPCLCAIYRMKANYAGGRVRNSYEMCTSYANKFKIYCGLLCLAPSFDWSGESYLFISLIYHGLVFMWLILDLWNDWNSKKNYFFFENP